MKTPIAIVLITMGSVLIAVPPLADWSLRADTVRLMEKNPQITSVSLQEPMSETYRLGCWSVGTAMIFFTALASLRSGKGEQQGA